MRRQYPLWLRLCRVGLCATQKPENVHEAKRITVRHCIGYGIEPESGIVNEGVNILPHKLSVYALTTESGIVNEGARPPEILLFEKMVSGSYPQDTPSEKPEPENGIVNDPARGEHVSLLRENGDEGPTPSATIEEKQESGAGTPALAVSGEYARPGHLEVLTPENDTPSAQQLRREELEYTASYGDTDALIALLNEDETLLNENAASGRASSPEPFAAKAAPGSTEVSPPVTTEDTNPARVRLSWGQHRQTAAQSRQDKATEKQESGAGTPALAVSGIKAGPGHTEVLTLEKAPPPSSQRSVMIKQHQAYLARLAAMRTELEQAGLKGEILEEALRQMMKDD